MENLQFEIKKLNTIIARQIFTIDVDNRIEVLVCEKNIVEVVFDTGEKHLLAYNEYLTETIENLIKYLK
jgi:hypothetical protein